MDGFGFQLIFAGAATKVAGVLLAREALVYTAAVWLGQYAEFKLGVPRLGFSGATRFSTLYAPQVLGLLALGFRSLRTCISVKSLQANLACIVPRLRDLNGICEAKIPVQTHAALSPVKA